MNNLSASTLEYTYPFLMRIMLLVFIPFLLIPIFFSGAMDLTIVFVLWAIFGALLVYMFVQMTGKITTDASGLTFTRPLREPVHMLWQELGSISGNYADSSVRLLDRQGERKVSFGLMLQGFERLVDEIYTQRTDLFQVQAGTEIGASPLRWLQVVFFVMFLLLFLSISLMSDSSESALMSLIFLGVMSVFMVSFIFFRPSKIIFEQDRLRITALFRSREIPRNAILNVRLTVSGGKSRHLRVHVDYHDPSAGKDQHINLNGFACGSPRLYGAIRSWAGIIG
jgi:hypothetical protein